MTTIQAIYQEIAGSSPDREAVARIGRAGRLLNLTDTDSGWLLLAVLAAHGALAQADLQAAATLAASLSVAANEARVTTKAVTHAADTATAAITRAIDDAKPALAGTVDDAAKDAADKLRAFYNNLGHAIEAVGSDTGDALVARIDAMKLYLENAITTATGEATGQIRKTVDTIIGQAVRDIMDASDDLSNSAVNAHEKTINNWRATVATAIDTEFTTRSRIDTQAAKRQTIRAAALAGSLVTILIAGVGYGAHQIGWQDGMQYATGETLTRIHDQKARASWANTPTGQLAYKLYQAGSIRALATCKNPGWQLGENGTVCFPEMAVNKKTYGWAIAP